MGCVLSEESLAAFLFGTVSLTPLVISVGVSDDWGAVPRTAALAAGALATVPWFLATCLPAYAAASVVYGGCAWPLRWSAADGSAALMASLRAGAGYEVRVAIGKPAGPEDE